MELFSQVKKNIDMQRDDSGSRLIQKNDEKN